MNIIPYLENWGKENKRPISYDDGNALFPSESIEWSIDWTKATELEVADDCPLDSQFKSDEVSAFMVIFHKAEMVGIAKMVGDTTDWTIYWSNEIKRETTLKYINRLMFEEYYKIEYYLDDPEVIDELADDQYQQFVEGSNGEPIKIIKDPSWLL